MFHVLNAPRSWLPVWPLDFAAAMQPVAPVPAGIYLRDMADPLVPARVSIARALGAGARARQLQAFLAPLQQAANPHLGQFGGVELWVLGERDWQAATSAPYGWPLLRIRAGARAGAAVAMVAAAEIPGRLLKRFDPVLLAAARAGVHVDAAAAGANTLEGGPWVRADARELVDLTLGHEWGHARLVLAGLRTRVKWVDEVMAMVVFVAALRTLDAQALEARWRVWLALQRAGGAGAALAQPPRFSRRAILAPAGANGLPWDPSTFDLPRGRMPLPALAYAHGTLAALALALVDAEGWGTLQRWATLLDGLEQQRGRSAREDVTRALLQLHPSVEAWMHELQARPMP